MSSAILLFILNFIKEILSDVIKDYLSTPPAKVAAAFTGSICVVESDPDLVIAEFERVFNKDSYCETEPFTNP